MAKYNNNNNNTSTRYVDMYGGVFDFKERFSLVSDPNKPRSYNRMSMMVSPPKVSYPNNIANISNTQLYYPAYDYCSDGRCSQTTQCTGSYCSAGSYNMHGEYTSRGSTTPH